MAEDRRYAITPQLDIEQILLEAQHRWLRPAEICEIIRNYQKFYIAPEPPNKPLNGSLFLFDRKVLRYFRKDGHNWRKKKDGKTVKEAHERLKSGSVDVLHCYYAHGEENENFQRRSYWMLEEHLMHIVLVHYREVQGNKPSFRNIRENDDTAQIAPLDTPVSSNSFTQQTHLPPQIADAESASSTQTAEHEDAESADNYQASSRYHSYLGLQQFLDGPVTDARLLSPYVPSFLLNDQCDYQRPEVTTSESGFYSVIQDDFTRDYDEMGLELTFNGSRTQLEMTSLDEVLNNSATGFEKSNFLPSVSPSGTATLEDKPENLFGLVRGLSTDGFDFNQVGVSMDRSPLTFQVPKDEVGLTPNVDVKTDPSIEHFNNASSFLKQPLTGNVATIGGGECLKKHDSFSRWMSKELVGEVEDTDRKSISGVYWNTVDSGHFEDSSISNQELLDPYLMTSSLSEDQLFSIIDFSPSWADTGSETKVLVMGKFMKDKREVDKCKWSCMFGEVEVPAEVLADGILRCHAPPHRPGRVPFYITCSNRLACSEVREFEYRANPLQHMETPDSYLSSTNEMNLHIRLERLLSLGSADHHVPSSTNGKPHLSSKISSLLAGSDDEWFDLLKLTYDKDTYPENAKNLLLEKLLKDKLHSWLLHKVAEEGKGPNVLDKEGQGVLHLAAALGYDWAMEPTVTAGVSINFRDIHGWTALHWAAFFGRERTVVTLVALGAATGALTDPTPEFPTGRTPADLASANKHKGIAGFLAESSLTSHLSTLRLKDLEGKNLAEVNGMRSIEDIAKKSVVQIADGNEQATASLKDSLSAVRNAAQAAARIHQVFRVQSFQRKKLIEYSDDKYGMSDEHALSLVSLKASKLGQHDLPVHAAAIKIQNKFRGWKGRKEFLIIRQRIVKIQAHVRGHQVRKHYRKIIWSVGIVEKAILRWRRKGCGLRGFKSEGFLERSEMQSQLSKEDDYDFLREGRKQTEDRLEKALARVKSMVQYPEARDQYRRLLTVATELQESKATPESLILNGSEADDGNYMIELEELWEGNVPSAS